MKKFIVIALIALCWSTIFYYALIIYGFKEAKVIYSTDSASPLTAKIDIDIPYTWYINVLVSWEQESHVPIEYWREYDTTTSYIPILGLFADSINTIHITYKWFFWIPFYKKTFFIKTHDLDWEWFQKDWSSSNLKVLENKIWKIYSWLYGFSNNMTFIDQNGYVRWKLVHDDFEGIFTQLKNGNLLIGSKKDKIRYHYKAFYEVDLYGKIIKKYDVPNMFHHDIIELENGNLLTTSSSEYFEFLWDPVYREDTIIEIDRKTWEIVKNIVLWDYFPDLLPEKLEQNSYILPTWETIYSTSWDWVHINSLFLQGDSLIVSMKNTHSILKLDMQTLRPKWILWKDMKQHKSILPITLSVKNSDEVSWYEYPLSQHTAFLQEDYLVLFDNGTDRGKYFDGGENTGSRVMKYYIDPKTMSATLKEEFIHPLNIFTPLTGSVFPTDDGYIIWYTFNREGPSRITLINVQWEIMLEVVDTTETTYYRALHLDIIQ